MSFRWLMFLGFLFVLSPLVLAGEGTAIPYVSVQGKAEKNVEPDELVWYLSIRNQALETDQVAKKHAALLDKVIKYLKKEGIPPKDIQTTRMQLSENKEYRQNRWIKHGFFASSSVTFKLKNLEKYFSLWQGLAAYSEVSMNGFNYQYSKSQQLESELQKEALLAAKQKAQTMANVLGMKIGEPLSISETETDTRPIRITGSRVDRFAESAPSAASVSAGTIKISKQVYVTFALESQ